MLPYSFPHPELSDAELVAALSLEQPLPELITFKAPQLLALHHNDRSRGRFILSFDKGMGKTITYMTAMRSAPRLLIMCPENAVWTQLRHIRQYFPQWADRVVNLASLSKVQRAGIHGWSKPGLVYLHTPIGFLADMGMHSRSSTRIAPAWAESVPTVVDEYHRFMRSRTSAFYTMMKARDRQAPLILSSGSAGGKGPQDIWAALNVEAPTVWTSYWKYVERYCEVSTGFNNARLISGARNIPEWREKIAPWVIHRLKDLKDYPVKTRQALEVRLPPWQQNIHDKLRKDLMVFIQETGEFYLRPNILSAMMTLRQFLVCPKTLDPGLGYGAYLEAVLDDVKGSELKHFVITTPFKAPIPWIEQFFRSHDYHVETLTGGQDITAEEMDKRITRWTKRGGVVIQTTKYAQSYELPAARVMYMMGAEYVPDDNTQAEDRIHRDIRVTPHPVDIYYLKGLGTVEEQVMERLSTNADTKHALMDAPLTEILGL